MFAFESTAALYVVDVIAIFVGKVHCCSVASKTQLCLPVVVCGTAPVEGLRFLQNTLFALSFSEFFFRFLHFPHSLFSLSGPTIWQDFMLISLIPVFGTYV